MYTQTSYISKTKTIQLNIKSTHTSHIHTLKKSHQLFMSKKNFAVAWLGSFPIYWNCWTRLSFSSVPIQLNIVSNSMSSFCCVAAGESSTSIFWALLLSFSLEIGNSSMHNSRIPSVHFPHCQLFQQIWERILINVDNLRRKTKLRAKFYDEPFWFDVCLTFLFLFL